MLEEQEIKQEIIAHIEKTFPPDKKAQAISQLQQMNSEELESFLEKNNLIREGEKCIFCSIISGELSSCKLSDNEEAISILELNPISKGHALIIPKKHGKAQPKSLELAQQIADKIKEKLNPDKVSLVKSEMFGHEIVNVIPVYKDETINSPRQHSSLEGLEKVKEELMKTEQIKQESIKEPVEEPKKEQETKEKLWLPKRIP